ncbi:MAG: SGNH/GDSL hydrolase family protein, partial [Actinomycetes bacterium]
FSTRPGSMGFDASRSRPVRRMVGSAVRVKTMKADVAIATVIAVAGAIAIGQAVTGGSSLPAVEPGVKKTATVTNECTTYTPPRTKERRISFAAVGDTVTDWRSSQGMRPESWVTYAASGKVRLVGGWAKPGVGTERISLNVKPVEADVVVLLAGTNDLMFPFAYDNVELSLQRTVDRIGADHVLLSSIPPVNRLPAKTAAFNKWLARVAYRHDWSFVDAGSTVRGSNCKYRPGLSSDGVRPTSEGARLIGQAIRGVLTTRPEFEVRGKN